MDDYRRSLPKSALAYYIQVYCKKREETKVKNNRVLAEAVKSWASLSKDEKQYFIFKYQEHKKCYRKAIAEQLKKTEPYLLKKNNTENKSGYSAVSAQIDNDTNDDQQQATDCKLDIHPETILELFLIPETIPLCNNPSNVTHMSLCDSIGSPSYPVDSHGSKDMQNHELQIVEPAPPKLLSGKDLFNLINENDNNLWNTLPKFERRRYHNAVCTIKNKYLKDYKNFLEQLPSEKLFHYHKNIVKLQE